MSYTEGVQKDFDQLALLPSPRWSANKHYHNYLISHIPHNADQVLEIGCGKGEFCAEISPLATTVTGIDLSYKMITEALITTKAHRNVSCVQGDYMNRVYPPNHFDCILSIATAHHMPMHSFLSKAKSELKANGKLIVLDLFQATTIIDQVYHVLSVPLSMALRIAYNWAQTFDKRARHLWKMHGDSDEYLTIKQLKKLRKEHLPGAELKRHLFWRYSLIWTKPLS